MKMEVYWVVRHSSTDDSILRAVAGPFCDQMDAYRAAESYEEHHILVRDYITVRTQEIEVI